MQTLEEAKQHVLAQRDQGVTCPCCDQYCKVYRRTIYAGMARFLIWLVKAFERRDRMQAYIDILQGPPQRGGDFAKLAYWELIEPMETKKGKVTRYWRPTDKGRAFAYDKATVPKHAMVFNGEVVGFSEKRFGIRDALGKNFNYEELMQGES